MPYGTIVVKAPSDNKNIPSGYFVLKDNPEIKGTQIKDPKPGIDNSSGGGGPIVSFQFKNGGAEQFHKVTKRLAQRAQTDQQVGESRDPADVRDRARRRDQVEGQRRPRPVPGRHRRTHRRRDQRPQRRARRRTWPTCSRPVRCRSTSRRSARCRYRPRSVSRRCTRVCWPGIVGLLIVALFLLAFYRLLGVIAVFALIVYGVIFFALIKLIPITLTLPGIAGLILTIGVAADSNIIIFERIKEELRAGQDDDVGDRDRLLARHPHDRRRERRDR